MSILGDMYGIFTGGRDRRRSRQREDSLRAGDRGMFLEDRANQRYYDSQHLRRLKIDAQAAGIHPLAALGAQTAGPATAYMSQSYPQERPQLPQLDATTDLVNMAQAKLLSKQADLVDLQIADSKTAKAGQSATPQSIVEALGAPVDVSPQTITPVIERRNTDPSIANAQTFTDRYGESEIFETVLALRNILKDWMYTATGKTNKQREEQSERLNSRQYRKFQRRLLKRGHQ